MAWGPSKMTRASFLPQPLRHLGMCPLFDNMLLVLLLIFILLLSGKEMTSNFSPLACRVWEGSLDVTEGGGRACLCAVDKILTLSPTALIFQRL